MYPIIAAINNNRGGDSDIQVEICGKLSIVTLKSDKKRREKCFTSSRNSPSAVILSLSMPLVWNLLPWKIGCSISANHGYDTFSKGCP
jgi:hypothetical protein